jgi:hypothetical protein
MNIKGSCHCKNVTWNFNSVLESVTACNCTLCSRYGALWAYGYLGEDIEVCGETYFYTRGSKINGYHFCKNCGCISYYLALAVDDQGRKRIAVNLRMIDDPKSIETLPIDHFEGLNEFIDLPRDGRCVKDMWF